MFIHEILAYLLWLFRFYECHGVWPDLESRQDDACDGKFVVIDCFVGDVWVASILVRSKTSVHFESLNS